MSDEVGEFAHGCDCREEVAISDFSLFDIIYADFTFEKLLLRENITCSFPLDFVHLKKRFPLWTVYLVNVVPVLVLSENGVRIWRKERISERSS